MTIMNNNTEYRVWIKTDDGQWVVQQDFNEFWVIQIRLRGDEEEYCVTVNFIDIDSYDIDDIKNTMHSFGYDVLDEVDSRIVAECLAEDIDDFCAEFKGTYEECEKWVEEYLKEHSYEDIVL